MQKSSLQSFLSSAWETLEVILVAIGTVFLIRTFLVQPFVVSGASMEPTFSHGNYLLVDEVTYRFREPARGEVVVFKYPLDKEFFFIKRIIGLPGERVIYDNGGIKIESEDGSGYRVPEEYLTEENMSIDFFPDTILTDNQYFVLGDNRDESFDSRNWGSVSREDIIGIARLRIFPISEFEIFQMPIYELSDM